jgi:hypothetical protein
MESKNIRFGALPTDAHKAFCENALVCALDIGLRMLDWNAPFYGMLARPNGVLRGDSYKDLLEKLSCTVKLDPKELKSTSEYERKRDQLELKVPQSVIAKIDHSRGHIVITEFDHITEPFITVKFDHTIAAFIVKDGFICHWTPIHNMMWDTAEGKIHRQIVSIHTWGGIVP